MTNHPLQKELQLILELSIQQPTAERFIELIQNQEPNFDWMFFAKRAIASNLAGHLLPYPYLAERHYPTHIFNLLKRYQQQIQLHSLQLLDILTEIIDQFERANLKYAVLKGCAGLLEQKYDFKKRQVSDVDLLIEPAKLDQVAAIFMAFGCEIKPLVYKSSWHERTQLEHAPLQVYKDGLSIDIHVRLFRGDTGYQIDTTALLHSAKQITFNNKTYSVLEAKAAALFNVLHIHKHLYFGNMFKVGGLMDLHQVQLENLESLALQWNAQAQLNEMITFWQSWSSRRYSQTFLGLTALRFLAARPLYLGEKKHSSNGDLK